MHLRSALIACITLLVVAVSSARAGFGGQPILGPLGPGGVGNGNTTGAADDNDGFTSGDHIFDFWAGPDDVWQLNWPGGGDLTVTMTGSPTIDLELFVYDPINGMDDSAHYSVTFGSNEVVLIPSAVAPAGTYYINVDSPDSATFGAYQLTISDVPEPGSLALAAVGLVFAARRRAR